MIAINPVFFWGSTTAIVLSCYHTIALLLTLLTLLVILTGSVDSIVATATMIIHIYLPPYLHNI